MSTVPSVKYERARRFAEGFWSAFLASDLSKLLLFSFLSIASVGRILMTPDPIGVEDLSPMWSFAQLFRPFDMPWDYKSNLGGPSLINGNAIYNIPVILLSLIFDDVALAHKIWIVLMLTLTGHGFYRLFNRIARSQLAGIFAAVFGIFNGWFIYHLSLGHNLIVFSYAVLPFAVASFMNMMRNGDHFNILSTAILGAFIFYISPQMAYIYFLFAVSYTILISLLSDDKFKQLLRRFSLLSINFTISIMLFLPVLVNILSVGTETYAIRVEEMVAYTMDIGQAISSNLSFNLQIFFLIATGTYVVAKDRSFIEDREVKSFFLAMIILSGAGLLFFSGGIPQLTIFLYEHLPGFAMFREVNKMLVFGVYLGALMLSAILMHSRRSSSRNRTIGMIVVVFIISLSFIPSMATGDVRGSVDTVQIPSYTQLLYEALDSDSGYYRIAYLPPAAWSTRYNWSDHFFLDPAVSLQPKPTLEIKSEMDLTPSARFARWAYFNIYRGRAKDAGALMGLTGVKYVILRGDAYLPPEREDLKPFSEVGSEQVAAEIDGIEKAGAIGPLEFYVTDRPLPHVYACDGVSLIVGDRRSLLGLLSLDSYDPLSEPSIFLDNAEDVEEFMADVGSVYIDPLRFEDLVLYFAQNKVICRIWEHLPLTSNAEEDWVRGEFAWYLKDGVADHAPDGYAMTLSGDPLALTIRVPRTGEYRLYVQLLSVKDVDFGGVIVSMDSHSETVKQTDDSPLGNYMWFPLGSQRLDSGEHRIVIQPEGRFAAISKVMLVPVGDYNAAWKKLQDALAAKRVSYLVDDQDWLSSNVSFVKGTSFSNGYAVKIDGEASVPIFIPKTGTFSIYSRVAGNGRVVLRIEGHGETLERIVSSDSNRCDTVSFSDLNLEEGWNNLTLGADGDVLIDQLCVLPQVAKERVEVPQPSVEMVSGSKYILTNPGAKFVVFVEGWNRNWRLRSDQDESSPIVAFGFANIFRAPKGVGRLVIAFTGADNVYALTFPSCTIVLALTVVAFRRWFKRGTSQRA